MIQDVVALMRKIQNADSYWEARRNGAVPLAPETQKLVNSSQVVCAQVSGDILNNVFEQNKAGSSQGAALFRLQSSGNIDSNSGLTSDNYVDQLPSSSAGGLAVAG